jgi:hypothetical protein
MEDTAIQLTFECWISVESAAVHTSSTVTSFYDANHMNYAVSRIERRVETGRKIVLVVKNSLAGRTSALRFEPALFI